MNPILIDRPAQGVCRITLNRPQRLNAINPDLVTALRAGLDSANDDADVRCILLTGAGRAFCAGDDLRDFEAQIGDPSLTRDYVLRIQDVTRAMLLGKKPVVGAVRGWAVGGGLEWVINCDIAIAAVGSRFFFPEIGWGLFVTGAVTHLLPRLVGLQKARELILFGEQFDAAQALDWGLLAQVVEDDQLDALALARASQIAAMPAAQVQALKRCLAVDSVASLEAAMDAETAATIQGFLDPQTKLRIARFGG